MPVHPFTPKVLAFCETRLKPLVDADALTKLETYLCGLADGKWHLPTSARGDPDWEAISLAAGVSTVALKPARRDVGFLLQAIEHNCGVSPRVRPSPRPAERDGAVAQPKPFGKRQPAARPATRNTPRARPGPKPREIVERPQLLFDIGADPADFAEALGLQVRRHGENAHRLHRAVVRDGETTCRETIHSWITGAKVPRSAESLTILDRIERRYRLPNAYFADRLPHQGRAATGHELDGMSPSERRRLAWHLPNDFNQRSPAEQNEIVEWVQRVIISGSTDYRRFQAAATKQRYAVRFPGVSYGNSTVRREEITEHRASEFEDPDISAGVVDAPTSLAMEMAELVRFKTSTLTQMGFQRNGVWGEETTSQKIEHLGLMFGALAASPDGPVRGYGVPRSALTFALLVLPSVWDWYVQWRERRRGFYTSWEVDMLRIAMALMVQPLPGSAAAMDPDGESNIDRAAPAVPPTSMTIGRRGSDEYLFRVGRRIGASCPPVRYRRPKGWGGFRLKLSTRPDVLRHPQDNALVAGSPLPAQYLTSF